MTTDTSYSTAKALTGTIRIGGNTFPARDCLKAQGARWDAGRKTWTIVLWAATRPPSTSCRASSPADAVGSVRDGMARRRHRPRGGPRTVGLGRSGLTGWMKSRR